MVVVIRYSTFLTDRGSSVETTRNSDLHLVKKEAGEGRGEQGRAGHGRAGQGNRKRVYYPPFPTRCLSYLPSF